MEPPKIANVIDPAARELAAIAEARKAVQARIDAAKLATETAAKDPAVLLAEARIALAREMAAADVAEHEVVMDRLYREACERYGFDGVARIPSARGSILLRVQTETEADVMISRRDANRRSTPDKDLGVKNGSVAMNEGLRFTALAPLGPDGKPDLRHFDKTVERYHGLWNELWEARNRLISGRVAEEKKDVAR